MTAHPTPSDCRACKHWWRGVGACMGGQEPGVHDHVWTHGIDTAPDRIVWKPGAPPCPGFARKGEEEG